jgi:hypothetical protein
MTDKKEGPAKDAGRPLESQGVKRPHATLDLKATEVKEGQAKSSAEQDAARTGSAPVGRPGAAPAGPDVKAAPRPATGTAPKALPRGAGPGGVLSHLLAGLAGGGLALVGMALFAQKPTMDTTEFIQKTAALEERLGALEKAGGAEPVVREPLAEELQQKFSDAEGRLAKLEEESRQIGTLNEAQTKLAADTKALADKIASEGATADDRERIGKLEERLQMLAAAAESEPDGGRVPQLAAITGKITELETSLATEMRALRTSVDDDVTKRLAPVAEASEAAKSTAEAADHGLAGVREDAARLSQRLEALKADTDRLAATSKVLQQESGMLSSTLGQLKSALDAQFKGVARPSDIQSAVSPVSSRLAALEQNLAGVVKNDEDRRVNAERIVLSLELANLKRVIESGQSYASELDAVRKVAGGRVDLGVLERFKEEGVPTEADLSREFRPVMNAVIDADTEPVDGSVVDRLIAGAKSVVRVRRVSHEPDDKSAEAVVARMDAALKEGQLGDVIELARTVPQRASAPLQDWLAKVEARYAVSRAIAMINDELKASLGGATAPAAN